MFDELMGEKKMNLAISRNMHRIYKRSNTNGIKFGAQGFILYFSKQPRSEHPVEGLGVGWQVRTPQGSGLKAALFIFFSKDQDLWPK